MKQLLLAFAFLAVGCSSKTSESTAASARIDGAQAKKLVADGALLLDVRSQEEFAEGHIDGAQNIPVNELPGKMATLSADKPIVVYCAVGGRAKVAAAELAAAGFKVHNLGAMAAWKR